MTDPVEDYSELISRLRSMDPYEFEKLVGALWEQQGYEVNIQPASRDRGIDIVARKADPFPRKQLLQTKRYNENNTIGSKVVRQYRTLYDQDRESSRVAIISTSQFSNDARELARDLQVELVDGTQLCKLLIEHAPHLNEEFFEPGDDREEDREDSDLTYSQGTKYGHLLTGGDTSGGDGDEKSDSDDNSQPDSRMQRSKGVASRDGGPPKEGKADIVDRYFHIIEDLDSKS